MAIEPPRKCGYRKIGGLYLVGTGISLPCAKMPFNLTVCPVCNEGIKFSRGWKWINAQKLVGPCDKPPIGCVQEQYSCPFNEERTGLLWVGKKFYTPEELIQEAKEQGVCKRISSIPHGFQIGKHWILLAHQEGGFRVKCDWEAKRICTFKTNLDHIGLPSASKWDEKSGLVCDLDNWKNDHTIDCSAYQLGREPCPAIFYAYRPVRIELIITDTQSKDEKFMEDIKKRNITPVIVPDSDKDHQGSVWDKEAKEDG